VGKYVFGPVPSRRLGMSLGVNNIPAKHCTYSCVYCQLGRTMRLGVERREFYPPDEVANEVIESVRNLSSPIDYVTFVPDGEPTLDINLGNIVEKIKEKIEVPVAVLTNASLIFRDDVRSDLSLFDLVSLKVDSALPEVWSAVNRPHPRLSLDEVLEGIMAFARSYRGILITETMLVSGLNTSEHSIRETAKFISRVNPFKAYISIPIRPPAEAWVNLPSEDLIVSAYSLFAEALGLGKVELLSAFEGPEFTFISDPIKDFLAIVSVHPMRLDYAYKFFERAGLNPNEVLEDLIRKGSVVKVSYGGRIFIMRKFSRPR